MTVDMQEDEVAQVIDESGLIEDNLNLMNIDDSLLLDFVYSKPLPGIERRRHKRFRVNVYAFALVRSATAKPIRIHGRGMGQIACSVFRSKPTKLGRINNISMGGLMFRYVDSDLQPKESLVLDILLADSGFYLESLRFKSISDLPVPNDLPDGFIQMKQLHVDFERLAPHQTAKLKYFIGEVISR